jgi:hypothetical protein
VGAWGLGCTTQLKNTMSCILACMHATKKTQSTCPHAHCMHTLLRPPFTKQIPHNCAHPSQWPTCAGAVRSQARLDVQMLQARPPVHYASSTRKAVKPTAANHVTEPQQVCMHTSHATHCTMQALTHPFCKPCSLG